MSDLEHIQKIAEIAGKQLNKGQKTIYLIMPQRKREYTHYYLCGENSPKGQRISFCKQGEIIEFDAIDVLAFCMAKGAKINLGIKHTT